ncbi:peroxiredoxin Q/BCP [Sphingomonas laterariae]|uniref:thioredoxin-dependent peroxiredoxin n=1 Tax=Edaphosphingomonas laterariae TaxID=861865 RepID=A0A239EIU7_9SPHN|nr:peroxiredoxin [Sphingomonas laterariae]SNS44547.1 peroxiredoxin Q/BCP [Sphingomonas laterariae]
MLNPGDKAPDVTLQMADGSLKPLAELARPLVLYFYPKDDTSGCTTEALDFTALAGDFAAAGVGILGVSKDKPAKHQKFIAKHDLKVDLATDADDSVCEAFGTWVEKSMYGRKYMGIERATFLIGKDGTIARIWRKVKVSGHAAEVLEAAKSLA